MVPVTVNPSLVGVVMWAKYNPANDVALEGCSSKMYVNFVERFPSVGVNLLQLV